MTFFNKAPKGRSKTPFRFPNAFIVDQKHDMLKTQKSVQKRILVITVGGRQQLLPRSLVHFWPETLNRDWVHSTEGFQFHTTHCSGVKSWSHLVPKRPCYLAHSTGKPGYHVLKRALVYGPVGVGFYEARDMPYSQGWQ